MNKYKESAKEYLNGAHYTTFPTHLFAYITQPKKGVEKPELLEMVNKINDNSVKGKWGIYQRMSADDKNNILSELLKINNIFV